MCWFYLFFIVWKYWEWWDLFIFGLLATMAYEVPTTKISSMEDLQVFLESNICAEYIQFLENLNASMFNKVLSDVCHESQVRTHISPLSTVDE